MKLARVRLEDPVIWNGLTWMWNGCSLSFAALVIVHSSVAVQPHDLAVHVRVERLAVDQIVRRAEIDFTPEVDVRLGNVVQMRRELAGSLFRSG